MTKPLRPCPPQVSIIEVVKVMVSQGSGVVGDPARMVTYYFDKEGNLLATKDDWYENEGFGDE